MFCCIGVVLSCFRTRMLCSFLALPCISAPFVLYVSSSIKGELKSVQTVSLQTFSSSFLACRGRALHQYRVVCQWTPAWQVGHIDANLVCGKIKTEGK